MSALRQLGLGVRTRQEIDCEKFALKVLRGDFRGIELEQMPPIPRQVEDLGSAVRG